MPSFKRTIIIIYHNVITDFWSIFNFCFTRCNSSYTKVKIYSIEKYSQP